MKTELRRALRRSIGMSELLLTGLAVVSDANAGGTSREYRRALARRSAREAKKETARLGNQTSRAESKATSDHAASNLTQRETQHHEITR